ncbi:hypothetical protein ACM61V_22510 [Sphingomonas sp. TX0543]|uniref:hypothetical protein n=1 Tax=Sphingomonas sp. TX0543 TaxID=3399682 RepID=UPI003AFB5FB2
MPSVGIFGIGEAVHRVLRHVGRHCGRHEDGGAREILGDGLAVRLGQRGEEVAEFGVEREGDGLGVGIDAHDRDLTAKCPDPMSRMPSGPSLLPAQPVPASSRGDAVPFSEAVADVA